VKLFLVLATSAALAAQTSEFVADPMPTPSSHASTIVELESGDLMAAWFGGAGEGRPDVAIWGARRHAGKWQAPVELVREPNIATWNPVLFRSGDGLLWLYYKFGPSPQQWTAARMWSRDEGKTWSVAEHLPAGLYGPIRAKPLVLPKGLIVSGTSVESYNSWAAWVERSTDFGKTWTRHGPIVPPNGGIIQPSVVQVEGDHLRFYARSDKAARICVSDSYDAGVTWTPARLTELPNPNSGIDAIRLKDGRYLMVYNHTPRGRTPLNLAISSDGDHWTPLQTLESEPGEYSYPAMIQASDGQIHITYTWQRKKIKHLELTVPPNH
jgi:predicted neuraminidase